MFHEKAAKDGLFVIEGHFSKNYLLSKNLTQIMFLFFVLRYSAATIEEGERA